MAISFINRTTGGGPGPAIAVTATAANHIAGNLLVVLVTHQGGADVPAITDTAGNSWTNTVTPYTGGNSNYMSIFHAANCLGNAANAITATWLSSLDFTMIVAYQFANVATSSALDNINSGNTATSAAVDLGSLGNPGDLIVAWIEDDAGTPLTSSTFMFSSMNQYFTDGYALVNAPCSPKATCATSAKWKGVAAAFKPADNTLPNNYKFLHSGDGMSVSEGIR